MRPWRVVGEIAPDPSPLRSVSQAAKDAALGSIEGMLTWGILGACALGVIAALYLIWRDSRT